MSDAAGATYIRNISQMCRLWVKATSKSFQMLTESRRADGRLFQARAASTGKARSLRMERPVGGASTVHERVYWQNKNEGYYQNSNKQIAVFAHTQ